MKNDIRAVLLFFLTVLVTAVTAAEAGFSSDPEAIEEAAQSVLQIYAYDDKGFEFANGSAFLWNDGRTLVTSRHVLEGARAVSAVTDDDYEFFLSEVLLSDAEKDIAVLRFDTPVGQPLETYRGELLRGERVVTIGSPVEQKNTVSIGNIGALFRYTGGQSDYEAIRFTAPVSTGSGGGPLLNDDGLVIGITAGTINGGQNLNVAIRIDELLALWETRDGNTIPFAEAFASGRNSSTEPEAPIDPSDLPAIPSAVPESIPTEESSFAPAPTAESDPIEAAYALALSAFREGRFFSAREAFLMLGDYRDSAVMAKQCAQPHPSTGELYRKNGLKKSGAKLTVDNRKNDVSVVYRVYDHSDTLMLTIFVEKGRQWYSKFPAGTYRLRECGGIDWFGETELFGPNGYYIELMNDNSPYFALESGCDYVIEITPGTDDDNALPHGDISMNDF